MGVRVFAAAVLSCSRWWWQLKRTVPWRPRKWTMRCCILLLGGLIPNVASRRASRSARFSSSSGALSHHLIHQAFMLGSMLAVPLPFSRGSEKKKMQFENVCLRYFEQLYFHSWAK